MRRRLVSSKPSVRAASPCSTVTDTGKAAASDEEQLTAATTNECVLYTFNVADFYKIHMQWTATGREHAGIILAPQQRCSVGEQLRRLLPIRSRLSMDDMRDRAEFLANWS